MRALAVLLVIVAHAGFRTASGGFVGVDVFFVISGFLITSLLLREVERTGRVGLVAFYARRARRILPAALVVLVVTALASLVVLPAVRVLEVLEDAVWSALFAANVRFALVGTDYFAQGEPSSPLQHYWSLAVEEQFYLVWPLLVLAWAALRTSGRVRAARLLLLGAGLVALGSLAWSWHASTTSPVTAYFSTLTRAWELAAGALTAIWATRARELPRGVRQPMAVLGVLLILGATLALDGRTVFPGLAALAPVLGTVLLIAAGTPSGGGDTVVGRLLSVRPARVVGDWSFSLYLWHWPVLGLAEAHYGVPRLPPLPLLLVLVLVLVLSAGTYRWVEEPFRRRRGWVRPRHGIALYPATVVVVGLVAVGGQGWIAHQLDRGHAPAVTTAAYADEELSADPHVALVQASVLAAREGRAVPGDLVPDVVGLRQEVAPLGECDYRTGTTRLCNRGDPDAERTVVLLGDSVGRSWAPALEEVGRQEGYAVYPLVHTGCSAHRAVQGRWDPRGPWRQCEEFKDWALHTIGELRPDLVVVATSAVSPVQAPRDDRLVGIRDDGREFLRTVGAGFDALFAELGPRAERVVVLGDTPKLRRMPGACLSDMAADLGDCLFRRGRPAERVQQELRRAAERAGVGHVDVSPWFCHQGGCPAVVGRTITMRDRQHLTPDYARSLSEPVAEALELTR